MKIAKCEPEATPLPCVKKCRYRLKKCLLPWLPARHESPTCGSTPAEECLAKYVCCIDDYCCGEPECIETGACETTCTTGQPDCCCEGKTCVPVSQGVTDGTCQATICSETLCDIGGVDTCCPDTGKTCDTSNNVCVLDCPVDEVICGAACCPSDNCLDGVRCCPEPICVIGGSGGTPTCCPDTSGTCVDGGGDDASCAPCTKEDAPGWTPRVPPCDYSGCECDGVECCPGNDGQQPLCKPFPGSDKSPNFGKHKCACEVCDTDPGIVCCPDGEYCSILADSSEECVTGAGCETAFAIDSNDFFVEFCNNGDLMTNRWGWTNGPYTAANAGVGSKAELKMYAGAGQCEIPKGTEVGAATVEVDGITVTVTFTPTAMMFQFTEYHVQVSCDSLQYALQGGTETVAPGQYTVVENTMVMSGSTVTVVFAVGDSTNPIDRPPGVTTCDTGYWVIIHAVSCPMQGPD